MKCYLDTETCGLHGVAVIIQYSFDNGPIIIHEFWRKPIGETLELLRKIAECEVVAFNLAFDWFHLCKVWTIWSLAEGVFGTDFIPEDDIAGMASLEEKARDGMCYKPYKSLDLMLHARKTEFQITMERSDVRIRRVPTQLAWKLADYLEENIVLDSILFARRKNKLAPKWVVHDIKDSTGKMNVDFKDIVLKFKPSMALKALAVHVLNIPIEEVLTYQEVEVDKFFWPAEVGYAPYHAALTRLPKKDKAKLKKRKPWPKVIEAHISHWAHNPLARAYATKDVDYLRRLDEYFNYPTPGDDDSELASAVGAVRWRGYAIDLPGIMELKEKAKQRLKEVPTAPRAVKKWIGDAMSPDERAVFTSTGKVVLERMAASRDGEPCPFGPCEHCKDGRLPGPESAKRAFAVLEARKMGKEIELYDKLITARRFHASFKIIGALSGRMAGADKLNPQGIKRTKEVRGKFPLAFGGLQLWGGDFAGFEVVLADAAYNDSLLRKDLLTCEKCRDVQVTYTDGKKKCPKCGGKATMKIHALFGVHVYPDMNYDQIKATDGQADDRYNKSKSAVFAMIYGGEGYTLMTRLGVPIEVANEAYQKFTRRYEGVGRARQRVISAFCSIRQEGGIGSKIVWADPAEYVESLLGFRRYFILENRIVEAVFKLASNPPEEWKNLKVKVRRRDRDQTIGGAVQSALFGTSFQIQAGNMRAAANHEIQSSGAQITKHVQRKIWDLQPHGAHPWYVQPCNVHDEVLCPTAPEYVDRVNEVVHNAVESFRPRVPLIEFGWKRMDSWASK